MARKTLVILLSLLLLIASVFATGAFAMPKPFTIGERLKLTGEDLRYAFSPAANSAYAFYLFPGEGEEMPKAEVSLYRGNELLARGLGGMLLFEARLAAGETYTLALSGGAGGVLEVMRATLGRNFGRPIDIDPADGSFEKLLVRAGDAHWYAFTAAAEGPATIYAEPTGEDETPPKLRGALLDASGRTLLEAASAEGGGFSMDCALTGGAQYLLRISADDDTTGAYALRVSQDAGRRAQPTSVALSADELSLEVGGTHALSAFLYPEDAHPSVTFTSSDPAIVRVAADGTLRALAAGEAIITARGWGGAEARCRVSVARIPLSGIGFSQSEISLRAGESIAAPLTFFPADASDRRARYAIDDPNVAIVSPGGVVTGLAEGRATLVAVSEDGGHTDILQINVEPPAAKRRALLIGQQMYQDGVNTVRVGSINTAQSMAQMLENQSIDGERYQTHVLLDSTAAETVAAIRETFREAVAGDVSLFYITCHGYYENGMSFLQMYDGSVLSARDLEREFRKIPGTIVLIVDCCGSGGLIGETSALEDFNHGIVSAFSGRVGNGPFLTSKYKVIASASLDQNSYRLSFSEDVGESDMATVLSRALFDGAGWNIDRARRSAPRADMDFDRRITLGEISLYAARRVTWYLNVAAELSGAPNPYVQNVQVFPRGDPFVLFGR